MHNRPKRGYTVSYLLQSVEFVCLHHSLGALLQSNKFRSWYPLYPGVGVWGFLRAGVRVMVPIFKTMESESWVQQKWGLRIRGR